LTGFQFAQDGGRSLTLTFGQLFDEELERLTESLSKLDLANTFLSENIVDILEYVNGNGRVTFENDYASTQTFVDLWVSDKLELNHIHQVLRQLKNERDTVDFMDMVRTYNRRKEVVKNLQSLMDEENKDEYNLYDRKTKQLISAAYQTLNWKGVEE